MKLRRYYKRYWSDKDLDPFMSSTEVWNSHQYKIGVYSEMIRLYDGDLYSYQQTLADRTFRTNHENL